MNYNYVSYQMTVMLNEANITVWYIGTINKYQSQNNLNLSQSNLNLHTHTSKNTNVRQTIKIKKDIIDLRKFKTNKIQEIAKLFKQNQVMVNLLS